MIWFSLPHDFSLIVLFLGDCRRRWTSTQDVAMSSLSSYEQTTSQCPHARKEAFQVERYRCVQMSQVQLSRRQEIIACTLSVSSVYYFHSTSFLECTFYFSACTCPRKTAVQQRCPNYSNVPTVRLFSNVTRISRSIRSITTTDRRRRSDAIVVPMPSHHRALFKNTPASTIDNRSPMVVIPRRPPLLALFPMRNVNRIRVVDTPIRPPSPT